MNSLHELNADALRKAAELKEQIDTLSAKLAEVLGGHDVPVTKTPAGKHNITPEGRAAIAAGQKRRWRKFRQEQKAKAETEPATPAAEPTAEPAKVAKAEPVAA